MEGKEYPISKLRILEKDGTERPITEKDCPNVGRKDLVQTFCLLDNDSFMTFCPETKWVSIAGVAYPQKCNGRCFLVDSCFRVQGRTVEVINLGNKKG